MMMKEEKLYQMKNLWIS